MCMILLARLTQEAIITTNLPTSVLRPVSYKLRWLSHWLDGMVTGMRGPSQLGMQKRDAEREIVFSNLRDIHPTHFERKRRYVAVESVQEERVGL